VQSCVIVTANLNLFAKQNLGPHTIDNLIAYEHEMSAITTI